MSKSRGVALVLDDADIARWRSLILVTATCHVWNGAVGRDGYGRLALSLGGGAQRTVTPHQVAAHLAFGPVQAGQTVLHDCDFRLCCRTDPGHVCTGTQGENIRAAVRRGRHTGPHPGMVDVRGPQGLARAVQAALRESATAGASPGELSDVLNRVRAEGDPLAGAPTLFDVPANGWRGVGTPAAPAGGSVPPAEPLR